MEFTDKNMAKMVAMSLNSQKIFSKKKGFNSDELWNMKYLSKFRWEQLGEQQVQDNRTRKDRLMVELSKAKKQKELFMDNVEQSKSMMGMMKRKEKKMKVGANSKAITKKDFKQRKPLD